MDHRRIVVAILVAALVGCANRPTETPSKQIVKKIAILPIRELAKASLENKNSVSFLFPIAATGFYIDSRTKQQVFSEKLLAQQMTLGSDLTSYLSQALEKEGFQVVILAGVPRPPEDPEDVDYEKINTDADAVLHVYFDDIGLYSGLTSNDYLPRVNVQVRLRSTKRAEDLYDEKICYGVDARAGKTWAIAADPRFAYSSFDNVLARLPEIGAAFATGTQVVGKRAVDEIRAALK